MQLLESDEIQLLAQVGMLASARADVRGARAIHEALKLLRPDRDFSYAGLAICFLNAGQPDEAVRVLEQAVLQVRQEDQPDIKALLALALHQAGRQSESRRVAREAGHAVLARTMLGEPSGSSCSDSLLANP